MRRQSKSFTVEIKRRVGAPARKPVFIEMPDIGADSATVAADALFGAAKPAPAPTPELPSPAGRILPCLVTEAALDAAQVEEAPRRRGRSPKARNADETVIVAPRKPGRARKIPIAETRFEFRDKPEPIAAVVVTPYTPSERAIGRRSAVSALPRGERWKRRLPRVLRHRLSKSPD